MSSFYKVLLVSSGFLVLTCVGEKHTTLTGELFYPQRIALTKETVVTISLVDITGKDVEVPILAQSIIKNPGQFPIAFAIHYNSQNIKTDHRYSIQARILDNGKIHFKSETDYPVINNGVTDSIKIKVVPVNVEVKKKSKQEVELITPEIIGVPGV